MKNLLLCVLLLCFTVPAFAIVEVDTRGLTEMQKAELVKAAEQMKNAAQEVQVPTTEKVEEWVKLGEKTGKAFVSFSKELGLAADEFMKTNTGKLVAVMLIFNFGGDDLLRTGIHLLVAICFCALWIPVWCYYTWAIAFGRKKITEYEYTENGKRMQRVTKTNERDSEYIGFSWLLFAVFCAVTFIIVFSGI